MIKSHILRPLDFYSIRPLKVHSKAHHFRPIVSLVLLLVHPPALEKPVHGLAVLFRFTFAVYFPQYFHHISLIISLYSISFVNNFPSSGELESTLFNLSISVCLLVNGESESWTSNFIAKRSNQIFLLKTRNFCKIFYYKAVARSLLALAIFIWIFDQRPSIPAHSIYPKPIPSLATFNLDLF